MIKANHPQVVLEAKSISTHFFLRKARFWPSTVTKVRAVDNISFKLHQGEILGLVGESGCGKSTLALTLMNLETPTSRQVFLHGKDVTRVKGKSLQGVRRQIQMIFQDPYESLNPTMRIGDILAEPLIVHRLGNNKKEWREQRIQHALEDVGLTPFSDYVHRFPHELSGGQRQRIVIAAALVLEPTVLLADEPVSMLDVSIRAMILDLLASLCKKRSISVLLISHDLSSVAHIADKIAVMYLGKIVEQASTSELLSQPLHPYTRALLSAMPVTNPRLRRQRIVLQGETPSPIDLPSGCRFHPRCPIATARCVNEEPKWREINQSRRIACHEA